MAKEAVRHDIENCTFEFFPLPPREALKIVVRIAKILGEPFGHIIDSAAATGKGSLIQKIVDGEIGQGGIAAAMRAMMDRLDEDEVWGTLVMLLSKVHGQFPGDKGTRELKIDVDFTGDFNLFMSVAMKAAEVNIGPFFSAGLGGLISRSNPSADTALRAGT